MSGNNRVVITGLGIVNALLQESQVVCKPAKLSSVS